MRIIVIDDDVIFCEIMRKVGERRGIEVVTCSLPDTLKRPDTWNFDAAVIDYNLDFVDGVELTEYIRHFGCEVPIMLVSQTLRSSAMGWPHGIKGFIPKNLGADAIFAQIERTLAA
jgi:DNA-binding response OmpR family regulator